MKDDDEDNIFTLVVTDREEPQEYGFSPDEEVVQCPECGNFLLLISFSGTCMCPLCNTQIQIEWEG